MGGTLQILWLMEGEHSLNGFIFNVLWTMWAYDTYETS